MKIKATVTVTNHASLITPKVALAFDENRDRVLTEKPIKLTPSATGYSWTGNVVVQGESAVGLYVLLGWMSAPGDHIQLKLESGGKAVLDATAVATKSADAHTYVVS